MMVLLWALFSLALAAAFRPSHRLTSISTHNRGSFSLYATQLDTITYLSSTGNPAIGNFFDNTTSELSFIQCYMHCLGTIKGVQYGIGYPVDTPVLLTSLSENEQELIPVTQTFQDYDNLLNHVASQMDSNDLQFYKTPVVLTLQGYFEDEDEDEDESEDEDKDDNEDDDTGGYIDEGDEELDDNINDETDAEDSGESFWSSSPAGKLSESFSAMPDYTLIRSEGLPDPAIPTDPQFLVTEEDTISMKSAHRKADRITREASDVSLIASFHYQKRNVHLVRLLEPIFVVGRRIEGVKGYYFSLLTNEETAQTTPALEKLIFETSQSQARATESEIAASNPRESAELSSNRLRSRRRWRKSN